MPEVVPRLEKESFRQGRWSGPSPAAAGMAPAPTRARWLDIAAIPLVIRRRTFLIVFALALAGAVLRAESLPRSHEATATLVVGQNQPASAAPNSTPLYQVLLPSYRAIVTTPAMAQRVARRLPLRISAAGLLEKTRASVPNGGLLRITVRDRDPHRAQVIATTWAATFADYRRQQAASDSNAQVARLRHHIEALSVGLARLGVSHSPRATAQHAIGETELDVARRQLVAVSEAAAQGTDVWVSRLAAAPVTAVGLGAGVGIALGAAVSLLLALAAAFLVNALDRRVRDSAEASELLAAPVLGRLGRWWNGDATGARDAFQFVGVNLRAVARREGGLRSIAVSRLIPGRKAPPLAPALGEALRGPQDYVVVDAPPLLASAEASATAAAADGFLLALDLGRTPRPALVAGREQLRTARARLLGVVLEGGAREPALPAPTLAEGAASIGLGLFGALLAALAVHVANADGPIVPLAAMTGLGAAGLAFARPLAGLYLTIALTPLALQSFAIGPAYFSPPKTMLVITAVAWSLRRLAAGRWPIEMRSPLAKPYALLLLAVIPGLIFAGDRLAVVKLLALWLVLFLIYQMVVQEAGRTTVRNLLIVVIFAAATTALISLATSGFGTHEQLIGIGQQASGRPGGAFLSPNGLAGLLAIAIPLALALGLRGSAALRPLALAALVVTLVALMLSLSRGGMIAAVAAVAVMFAAPPFRRTAVITALALVLGAVAFGGPLGSISQVKTVSERLGSISYAKHGDPRLEIWRRTLGIVAKHPVFGVGGSNIHVMPPSADPVWQQRSATGLAYYRYPSHAHDIALNIAAELGLFGLFAFVWIAAALGRTLLRAFRRTTGFDRALAFAVAAALAGVFVQGLFDYLLSEVTIACIVVTLTACAVVLAGPRPATHAQPADQ